MSTSLIQSLKQQILSLVTSTDYDFQTFHLRQLGNSTYFAGKKSYQAHAEEAKELGFIPASLTGGITVTVLREEDEVALSVSVCSDKDNFNKTIGNRISLVRLLKFYNTPTGSGIVIPPLTCIFKINEGESLYEKAIEHTQLLVSTQLKPVVVI